MIMRLLSTISFLLLILCTQNLQAIDPVNSLPIPSKIQFAGQTIPLDRYDMRERFDRAFPALRRLPLSERISDAIVLRSGPYAPALQIACALETDDASVVRQLCETHEMDTESVNRALLRLLSELHVERPRPGQPTGSR